jgi:hypothetical protein
MSTDANPTQPPLQAVGISFRYLANAAPAISAAAATFRFIPPQALVEVFRTAEQQRPQREALAALERVTCAAQAQARDFHRITIQDRPNEVRLPKPARSTNESWRRQGKRPGRRS